MIKNRPLRIQFQLTFVWIVLASILATAVTYALAAVLYIQAQYTSVYPENYYERQIPGIDEYIRRENTALLAPDGEAGLRNRISGEGIRYQILNSEALILYGTLQEKLFENKAELYRRLNTTLYQQNNYIYIVPIIDNQGKIAGAAALSYQLKLSYVGNHGWWVVTILIAALFSPFLYIIGFTLLFSRIFVRRINEPLQLLMEASRKIKEQNLDFEISYHAENELGKLCDAFSEMQAELRESLSAQWKMEQERAEMVASLAHDLKAPLSVIKGYTDAIINTNINARVDSDLHSEEKLRRYLMVIQENVEKSVALVQQMQYAADLDQAGLPIRLVPLNLSEFLEHKLRHYEIRAGEKEIVITMSTQGELPTPFLIDPDRLERILDNIMLNSLQYTPNGGAICVSVKAGEETIAYQICDSGSGFSPKDLEKAFDRFYRGDDARRSREGHSGLGLSIARQLAEQLGGSIQIANAESGGACVTFWHKIFMNPEQPEPIE